MIFIGRTGLIIKRQRQLQLIAHAPTPRREMVVEIAAKQIWRALLEYPHRRQAERS